MLKSDIVFKFGFFDISLILFQNMSKYLHDIKKLLNTLNTREKQPSCVKR